MAKRKGSKGDKPEQTGVKSLQVNPFELAAPLAERAVLDMVLVAGCSASRTPNANPEGSDQRADMQLGVGEATLHKEENAITFKQPFSLICKSDGQTDQEADIKIECTFVAQYSFKNINELSNDSIQAFLRTSVVFVLWPYWREFVHSMSGRLGLKSILVPLFRFSDASNPPAEGKTSRQEHINFE